MTVRNLDALLAPASVALIGASAEPGSVGLKMTQNLLAGRLRPVHLVNPRRSEIQGHRCYPSVAALPAPPALGVIATPPRTVPGAIADLAAAGARAAVVVTAGLDAATRQAMLDAARPSLLRVLGPNGIGLMLPPLGLDATFAHRPALPGRLAFLSQSGALITTMVDWAAARGIGFSHVVSVGDMADVDFGDLLDYLAGDIASSAILLYVEAITNAPKFMSAARRAARAKPVVVVKSGRHAASAKAAASHTGRLAGADAVYDAAFRRAGVLRVVDLYELFEAAETLARNPRISGERLTILTNGGGAGVLAADRVADYGGVLADLSPATIAALDKVLPANWSRGNPVDIIGDADGDRYARALEILLASRETDALLVLHCPTALADATSVAARVVECLAAAPVVKGLNRMPVLANWLGEDAAAGGRALFSRNAIPSYETPGSAARGFMHIVRYRRLQDTLMRTPPARSRHPAADPDAARRIIAAALAEGRTMLGEAEGKDLLAAYAIPVARSVTAATPEDARRAAEALLAGHGRAVLKILSDDITHKSDVGGVVLDLASADAVEEAARAMLARIRAARPDARVRGFTVSPMIHRPHAHELIVGMSVDATFGPMLMFGAGGVGVEVRRDTALAVPPLDLAMARDLIEETRVARLLAGYRNWPAADRDRIADVLVAVGALISDHPEIRELDINPLLADDAGVIAVDARVVIADDARDPRVAMSISPYPSEWVRRLAVDGLGEVLLRPILPEDEALYEDFFAHVTAEDRRLRFLAPSKSLSHGFIARLTQIDYAREMAFVAIEAASGRLLGVSRFNADPDFVSGEYAVLVRSDLKGRGLGWQLMSLLIEHARARGLSRIHGSVLVENTTMLDMCRKLGFEMRQTMDEPGITLVTLDLTRNP